MSDDLKNYDDKLVYFVIFNIALFLLINFNFEIILKHHELISLILTIPVLYFPIYVINNAIPENWKFFVLYPRKHKHHFASDVFTKLSTNKIKDEKIDVDLIIKNHYQPKDFDEEDDLWYDIYIDHRYDQKVYEHHRQFLFCRDFTIMILPLAGLYYLVLTYLLKITLNNIEILCLISVGEFVCFWLLTRYQNKKFALVVLEEETYKLKRKYYSKNS